MELAHVDNTISFPNTGLTDTGTVDAAVDFVSELMTKTLAGQNDEIIIEPRQCLYDLGTGIEITTSLRAEIDCENVVETEDKIEISLSGTVENDQGRNETFSLYFFMWGDRSATAPVKNNHRKTFGADSWLIRFEHPSEQLTDSVFGLDLYRRDLSGHRHSLGQWRGYLVFGSGR